MLKIFCVLLVSCSLLSCASKVGKAYKESPYTPNFLSAGVLLDSREKTSGYNFFLGWNLKPEMSSNIPSIPPIKKH